MSNIYMRCLKNSSKLKIINRTKVRFFIHTEKIIHFRKMNDKIAKSSTLNTLIKLYRSFKLYNQEIVLYLLICLLIHVKKGKDLPC